MAGEAGEQLFPTFLRSLQHTSEASNLVVFCQDHAAIRLCRRLHLVRSLSCIGELPDASSGKLTVRVLRSQYSARQPVHTALRLQQKILQCITTKLFG